MKNKRIGAVAAGFLCLFAAYAGSSRANAGFGMEELEAKEFEELQPQCASDPDSQGKERLIRSFLYFVELGRHRQAERIFLADPAQYDGFVEMPLQLEEWFGWHGSAQLIHHFEDVKFCTRMLTPVHIVTEARIRDEAVLSLGGLTGGLTWRPFEVRFYFRHAPNDKLILEGPLFIRALNN